MKTSKCVCQHCSQKIEFEIQHEGVKVLCPSCGMETQLFTPRINQIKSAKPGQIKWWPFILAMVPLTWVVTWFLMIDTPSEGGHPFGQALAGGILISASIIGGGVIYFLPTLVAWQKQKANLTAISILNIFLGWTILGWVGALVWANTVEGSGMRTSQ